MKYFKNYQNVTQQHELSKCCWKKCAKRLAQPRVATNLQFVTKKKKVLSVKCNKVKCNKLGTPVIDVK